MELDNYLQDRAVQHREVQDHESELFLSYFKDKGGIRILEGGIESGFKHVAPHEYVSKLLWLKGKKNVRVREVAKTPASLNDGDVFILDAGLKLYQWQGAKCGQFERTRAAQLSRAMDSDRDGKVEVIVIDQGSEPDEFWEHLGGKGDVADGSGIPDDDEWELNTSKKCLVKFSDDTGKVSFTKIEEGEKLVKTTLDTNDGYIVDVGNHVYVWIGSAASAGEKKFGLKYAQDYLREHDLPMVLPISLVFEGRETPAFNKIFH